jgi:hypothetical protein
MPSNSSLFEPLAWGYNSTESESYGPSHVSAVRAHHESFKVNHSSRSIPSLMMPEITNGI